MKESKNLKDSKNNILVGFYLDKIKNEDDLNGCLFGLANQIHAVDIVVLDGGLSNDELEKLTEIAKKPVVTTIETDEDGNPKENKIEANGSVKLNIVKTGTSNFSKVFNDLFNIALEREYEGMSVVEVDDALGANWYNIANEYMQENEEVGFFLPLVRNWKNGAVMGLMNDACWAEGFSEEAGKFDMNLLLKYNCANPLAGVYRVEELEEYSEEKDGRYYPMKESFKVSNYYEFFLRMIYNDIKVMTVPRVGYDFRVKDVEEFSHSSSKIPNNLGAIEPDKGGLSNDEIHFWMELAKKEYFFDQDREKIYEQEPQKA